jgi:hypothetical protein
MAELPWDEFEKMTGCFWDVLEFLFLRRFLSINLLLSQVKLVIGRLSVGGFNSED